MEKRYRVSGANRMFGHKPGSIFSRPITAAQEARLIRGGHIKIVSQAPPAPTPDTEQETT